MKTNKQKILNISLLIAAGSLLASCYSGGKYITPTPKMGENISKNMQINYKPNIKFISRDNSLAEIIKQKENKAFSLDDQKLSTLNLYIETKLIPDTVIKPSINLVGILKKQKQKYNYQVSYKLVDSLQNTITQGEVIGLSDEISETISNQAITPTKSAANDAAEQLIKAINSQISDILIDFKVVSTDKENIFIAVNKNIKLSQKEIFLVNELSGTTLNFVEIIKGSITSGTSFAKLKVLTGDFPKSGMTVTLQK